MRIFVVLLSVALFGAAKLPAEHAIFAAHRRLHFHAVAFDLVLREQIGQLGFIAALSGFRSLVADALFIQAHVAWERTEWGRVLLLFRQVRRCNTRDLFGHAAWTWWNADRRMNDSASATRTSPKINGNISVGKIYGPRDYEQPGAYSMYEAMAGSIEISTAITKAAEF